MRPTTAQIILNVNRNLLAVEEKLQDELDRLCAMNNIQDENVRADLCFTLGQVRKSREDMEHRIADAELVLFHEAG